MNEQVIQQITQLVAAAQQGNKEAVKALLDIETKAKQGDKQATAIMQVVQQIIQQLLGQTQAAHHGAKLQYVRSLKNQCPEGEELYYYKKGGSVGCGCKKKEDGGEIAKAQNGSAVDKFKNRQKSEKKNIQWTNKDDRKLDSLVMRKEYHKKPLTQQGEKDLKDLKERFKKSSNKNKFELQEEKCGGKVKKKEDGSKINKDCGGAVAKFKMHRLGGSLNGIPFMQNGTSKGGLPTAPKAEDRFKNGIKDSVAYLGVPGKDNSYFGESIKRVTTPDNAAILRQILFRHYPHDNDTIYTEVPEHTKRLSILPQVNIIPRKGFSFAQTPEYETLKRRFNTAWNLAK